MPTLRVTKNDEHLCTVGSDDVWMFSASVWADIWGPEVSSLTVTGSSKDRDGSAGEFMIWQLGHELKPNDRVAFLFTSGSTSSPLDQTPIGEPSDEEKATDYFAPIAEAELMRLESRAITNATCRWQFAVSGEEVRVLAPDAQRQHCSLHLLWNDHRPNRMRVSLSKSSLREISAREPGEDIFAEYVPLETEFELRVEA